MLFFEERELVPVNPAYFSRAKLPVLYNREGGDKPDRFLRFLDEAGFTDEDRSLLQLWCGFVLLGDNSVHKIMMFTGDAGSGKSTLIELLEMMLGHESIATLNVERLDDRFELGSFFEKRLLVAKDVSADALNSQASYMLKALSGDSLIKAEIKHQNRRVSLKGPFNIAITSNSDLFIKLQGDATAWQRRLIIIKFRKKPDLEVENKLSEKMFKDEGSVILNWMIQGAIRARAILDEKEKFPKTAEQEKRVNELLRLSDSVKAFVAEELQSDATGKITTFALHEAYENYCARNRVLPSPKGAFEREIVLRIQEAWGGEKCTMTNPKTGDPCRGYLGISFKPKDSPSTSTNSPVSTPPTSAPTAPTAKQGDPTPATIPPAETTIPATQAPPIQDPTTAPPTEPTPLPDVQF
jgi:P4 family phage/plasmid primase-like protien